EPNPHGVPDNQQPRMCVFCPAGAGAHPHNARRRHAHTATRRTAPIGAQLPPSPCSSLRNSRPRSAPNSRRRPTPNRSFSAPRRGAGFPYSATVARVGRHCCLRMESALSHEMGTGNPSLDDPADENSTNGTNGTGTATLTDDDLPETVHLPRQMRIEDEDTDEEISAKLRRHGARIGKGMVAPAV